MINEVIIFGGGHSIQELISYNYPLSKPLKSRIIIGCNFAYKFFPTNINIFLDWQRVLKVSPDITKNYGIPLSMYKNCGEEYVPGVYWFKHGEEFDKESNRLYINSLTGVAAISLAFKLMKAGTVYLLGYDWTTDSNKPTHFYQNTAKEVKHEGLGKVDFYQEQNPDPIFNRFNGQGLDIINVNSKSNITCFPTISLPQFLQKISIPPNCVYSEAVMQTYCRNVVSSIACLDTTNLSPKP